MTKVDIMSGFLGAGKTTLIKKLLKEAFKGEKVVLIENEFGEIGIDGGFLKEAGVQITEMNSGCICCSLVGDFGKALKEVVETYHPDRVIIEPSGVGKLSDVIVAVNNVLTQDMVLNSFTAVVDGLKCKMYMKNFGEFFNNQVESAKTIVISRSQKLPQAKLDECVAMLREHNSEAAIITTPWEELDGNKSRGILPLLPPHPPRKGRRISLTTTRSMRPPAHCSLGLLMLVMPIRSRPFLSAIPTRCVCTPTV